MTDLPTAKDIERLAAEAGMSIAELCRRAGVAQSSFTRWKRGASPTLKVAQKLIDATKQADAA